MNVLDVFLAEAFPPAKKPAGKPPVGSSKPPVPGNSPANDGDENAAPGGFGNDGGNSDALIAAQQAKEQKEQEEAAAHAQKEAEDAAEMARVKEMRVDADQEVMDDLETKFNTEDDKVIWHPSLDAMFYGGTKDEDGEKDGEGFASHMDKKMGLKKEDEGGDEQDGDEKEEGADEDVKKSKEEDDLNNKDPERQSKKKPKPNKSTGTSIVIKT